MDFLLSGAANNISSALFPVFSLMNRKKLYNLIWKTSTIFFWNILKEILICKETINEFMELHISSKGKTNNIQPWREILLFFIKFPYIIKREEFHIENGIIICNTQHIICIIPLFSSHKILWNFCKYNNLSAHWFQMGKKIKTGKKIVFQTKENLFFFLFSVLFLICTWVSVNQCDTFFTLIASNAPYSLFFV